MAHIGKYELIEELGRGGYGTVHRAHDPTLGVDRAIKILHPLLNSDPEFILRFRKEARLVAQIRHPNIIPVIELGQFEGWMYLVMEYMSGRSLRMRLQDGALPCEEAARVLRQVGDGLAYAHENGVIHRDIKPENILFDNRGVAYLSDFGFARSLSEASTSTSMSLTGGVLGTPAYMAPEAWEGKGWSPTADLYSLGCVFVEMLSGCILFAASSPVEAMKKHVIDGPKFPVEWVEKLPEGLETVLRKVLAKEADRRYQDVPAFLAAVDQLMAAPLRTQSPTLNLGKFIAQSGLGTEAPGQPESDLQTSETESESGTLLEEARIESTVPGPAQIRQAPSNIPDKPPVESQPAAGTTLVGKMKRSLRQTTSLMRLGTAGIAILIVCLVLWLGGRWVLGLFDTGTSTPVSPIEESSPDAIMDDGHEMVAIPAGDFQMGCDPAHNGDFRCPDDELPLHTVNLSAYYIGRNEITNGQYATFLNDRGSNLCADDPCITLDGPAGHILFRNGIFAVESGYVDHPVIEVTWAGADSYCQAKGGRLPTEAEWEKAARGSADSRSFPWGDASPTCSLAVFGDCVGGTSAVGGYPAGASPFGVLDMAGNVREWVNDWYGADYYSGSPASDPQGPASGTHRVLRGGGWVSIDYDLRLTDRYVIIPTYSGPNLGFRCARSP